MTLEIKFFSAPLYKCIEATDIKYHGHNKKEILLVCKNQVNDEIVDFLGKIMKAVNTDLAEDTTVIYLSDDNLISWAQLSNEIKVKRAIFFGIEPEKLGLHLKIGKYQIIKWNDIKILYSDQLEEIIADKNKKGFLWRELQKMFD